MMLNEEVVFGLSGPTPIPGRNEASGPLLQIPSADTHNQQPGGANQDTQGSIIQIEYGPPN